MSGEEPIISRGELTLLTVAMVCVVLGVLSPTDVGLGVFGIIALGLCVSDAVSHRRRTGKWFP